MSRARTFGTFGKGVKAPPKAPPKAVQTKAVKAKIQAKAPPKAPPKAPVGVPCPQAPCNRPPPDATCRVPGYGNKNLICKTIGTAPNCVTDWVCPTGEDVRMGRIGGRWISVPKAAPGAVPLQGYFGEGVSKKTMLFVGIGAFALIAGIMFLKR